MDIGSPPTKTSKLNPTLYNSKENPTAMVGVFFFPKHTSFLCGKYIHVFSGNHVFKQKEESPYC